MNTDRIDQKQPPPQAHGSQNTQSSPTLVLKVSAVAFFLITVASGVLAGLHIFMPAAAFIAAGTGILGVSMLIVARAIKDGPPPPKPITYDPEPVLTGAGNRTYFPPPPPSPIEEIDSTDSSGVKELMMFDFKALSSEEWNKRLERPEEDIKFCKVFNLTDSSLDGISQMQFPHLGKYDSSGYKFSNPLLIAKLEPSQIRNMPPKIEDQFFRKGVTKIELYFLIYDDDMYAKTKSRNLVYHPLVFQPKKDGIKYGLMGIFDSVNLNRAKSPTSLNPYDYDKRPVAFESFSMQQIHQHDLCYSPNNARFRVCEGVDTSSFYSALILPDEKRGIAFFALNIHNANSPVQTAAEQAVSMKDLKERLNHNEVNRLLRLNI